MSSDTQPPSKPELTPAQIAVAHALMVKRLAKPGEKILASLTPEKCELWHMASGLVTEAGEIMDAVKRHIIYEEPLKITEEGGLLEETGDLEFYLRDIYFKARLDRLDALRANMEKLLTGKRARYAEGIYSDAQAQQRADKN